MKRSVIICSILLVGALYSGASTVVYRIRLCAEWYKTPSADRADRILGEYAPVVRKIRSLVPEEDGILLVSNMDPAPLPYALFPRKIWQMQTEPETNAVFMDLPPSPYPLRSPESFPVSWRLDLLEGNSQWGGELTRLKPTGGNR
jgi:hypothetical protein